MTSVLARIMTPIKASKPRPFISEYTRARVEPGSRAGIVPVVFNLCTKPRLLLLVLPSRFSPAESGFVSVFATTGVSMASAPKESAGGGASCPGAASASSAPAAHSPGSKHSSSALSAPAAPSAAEASTASTAAGATSSAEGDDALAEGATIRSTAWHSAVWCRRRSNSASRRCSSNSSNTEAGTPEKSPLLGWSTLAWASREGPGVRGGGGGQPSSMKPSADGCGMLLCH
mmetsp:Transcript_50588/g.140362  ORF Transcript_50588/g.140362 Transcript_50588/m.140362 type:complete len:231 (+) Transcript_50588:352-1044(+)